MSMKTVLRKVEQSIWHTKCFYHWYFYYRSHWTFEKEACIWIESESKSKILSLAQILVMFRSSYRLLPFNQLNYNEIYLFQKKRLINCIYILYKLKSIIEVHLFIKIIELIFLKKSNSLKKCMIDAILLNFFFMKMKELNVKKWRFLCRNRMDYSFDILGRSLILEWYVS